MNLIFGFCLLILLISSASALITSRLIPLIISRAHKWHILDMPSSRKLHSVPIPRLGGAAIYPSLWIGSSFALFGSLVLKLDLLSTNLPQFTELVTGLLLGTTGIFMLGVLDDIKGLSASQKLAAQAFLAILASRFIPLPIEVLGLELHPELLRSLFMLWLILVPNAVNLMDGVDGLTGSMVATTLAVVGIFASIHGETGWLLIIAPVFVSTLVFLRFNWSPATLFLGDSGSLTLGFLVAYLALGVTIASSGSAIEWSPLAPILICTVWLSDTVFAILRRYTRNSPGFSLLIRRSVKTYLGFQIKAIGSIVSPDRGHIHHKLLSIGLGARRTVFVLSLIAFTGAVLGLTIFQNSNQLVVNSGNEFLIWATVIPCLAIVSFYFVSSGARKKFSINVAKENPETNLVDRAA